MNYERIELTQLRKLLDQGATLIEVLPHDEFTEEHLPGAINIPLKELDAEAVADFDRASPVVAYCWDGL